jgi:hypothetical protein
MSHVLFGQSTTIDFEISSGNFPKSCSFKLELRLNYEVINTQKIMKERRQSVSSGDYLITQLSNNSGKWNISYTKNSVPIITGSPQTVTFNFPKPLVSVTNAAAIISLEGTLTFLRGGKVIRVSSLGYSRDFELGVNYALRLDCIEVNNEPDFRAVFYTDYQLQDLIEGRIIHEPSKGQPFNISVPKEKTK